MSAIHMRCPRCLTDGLVDASRVGQRARCPRCGEVFTVEAIPHQPLPMASPWVAPDAPAPVAPAAPTTPAEGMPTPAAPTTAATTADAAAPAPRRGLSGPLRMVLAATAGLIVLAATIYLGVLLPQQQTRQRIAARERERAYITAVGKLRDAVDRFRRDFPGHAPANLAALTQPVLTAADFVTLDAAAPPPDPTRGHAPYLPGALPANPFAAPGTDIAQQWQYDPQTGAVRAAPGTTRFPPGAMSTGTAWEAY